MPINTAKCEPFHVDVANCLDNETAQFCHCGLDRMRAEHYAMKALLTAMKGSTIGEGDSLYVEYANLMAEIDK